MEKIKDMLTRLFSLEKRLDQTNELTRKNIISLRNDMEKIADSVGKLSAQIDLQFRELSRKLVQEKRSNQIQDSLSDLNESLSALRDYSSEKEKELRRWRECYDQKILRNFIARIADVIGKFDEKIRISEKEKKTPEDIDDLKFMRDCLLNALDSEGIISFGEEFLGKKYESGASSEIKFIPVLTEDSSLDKIVCGLQERGYKLYDGSGERLVQPATLRRYKFQK